MFKVSSIQGYLFKEVLLAYMYDTFSPVEKKELQPHEVDEDTTLQSEYNSHGESLLVAAQQ